MNKYWVMARSQSIYEKIKKIATSGQSENEKERTYRSLLAEATQMTPTIVTLRNTYQHVWGYYKKKATMAEKEFYLEELAQLSLKKDRLGPFLAHLAVKYQVQYLLRSRLITDYLTIVDSSTNYFN
ncbi:hypothetical protein FC81_GL001094 [Liquorilactobacillus capillatus DSM 19910]|uniref:DUF1722 domain-containing protein n=1 Tax=Liquorilactobacillus capillatus DSM 19910 TaxID=1423731 RepID=A0A0R1M1Z9_9LACO|nr:hypothetical protein FC81_GL001094 [Liquorilactobacillus capillatus DSM 19910]